MGHDKHPFMEDPEQPFMLLTAIGAFLMGLTVALAMLVRDAVSGLELTIAGLGLAIGLMGFLVTYRRSRRK